MGTFEIIVIFWLAGLSWVAGLIINHAVPVAYIAILEERIRDLEDVVQP